MFGQFKFGEAFFAQGAPAPSGSDVNVSASGFGSTASSGTVTVSTVVPVPNRIPYTNEAAQGYAPANYWPPKPKRHVEVKLNTGVLGAESGVVAVFAYHAHQRLASLFVHRVRAPGARSEARCGSVMVRTVKNGSDEESVALMATLIDHSAKEFVFETQDGKITGWTIKEMAGK